MRWNEDRAKAAVEGKLSELRSYSGALLHTVNQLSEKVLGKKQVQDFQPPGTYTGTCTLCVHVIITCECYMANLISHQA